MVDLPRLDADPPRERADAARNRVRILAAASRVFENEGVEHVSVDHIAAEAGVGKGTLFRRFGSKAGLAAAVLGERESELQEAVLFGSPPLGPGASADVRLRAFFAKYLELLERNLELVHLSETSHPGARYQVGAYKFWHTHVRVLLGELHPAADAEYVAHALLAMTSSDLVRALVHDGMTIDRIGQGITDVLDSVLTSLNA